MLIFWRHLTRLALHLPTTGARTMVTPASPSRPAARLNRAQVHTTFGKLQLSPAVGALAKLLLHGLDDDGTASVQALHTALFPLASTASASA